MITIWHNPKCSKSRQTLALLAGRDDLTIRLYLENPPTVEEIQSAAKALNLTAAQMMRTKDARFKEAKLSLSDSDETLLAAMSKAPILIERPIVFCDGRAAIGRPPEAILDIL